MPKHALVVQHTPHESLAGLADPIAAAGYAIEMVHAGDADFAAADLSAPDLLVLLGGPMAVYETHLHPWIAGEIAALAGRLEARRPTLGICLGAQMIAAALGATVAAGPVREVGFAPIVLTADGRVSPLGVLRDVPVFHWHGDGFILPADATLLARTDAYPQAFSLGAAILALQFHVEMGGPDDGIEDWIAEADGYLESAGTDATRLRADHARNGAATVEAGRRATAAWLGGLSL